MLYCNKLCLTFILGPTRKHDVVSLLYMMIYLFKNDESLWESKRSFDSYMLSGTNFRTIKEKLMDMIDKKAEATPHEVCKGVTELEDFYKAVMNLKYSETPNYENLKAILSR